MRSYFRLAEAFMASKQPETAQRANGGKNWPTTVASIVVGASFFALWFWLLPAWLGFHVDAFGAARWRWIAGLPAVLGFAVEGSWATQRRRSDFGRLNPAD